MTQNDIWERIQIVIDTAKARKWDPEVFKDAKDLLRYVDLFNIIRKQLPSDDYEWFDDEYCDYGNPGQKALAQYTRKERREKECRETKNRIQRNLQRMDRQDLTKLYQELSASGIVKDPEQFATMVKQYL